MVGSVSENVDFHNYDRELVRLLDKINGRVPHYDDRRGNMNHGKDYSVLTQKNRQLLLRVYNDCVLRGNSKGRTLAKIQRLTWDFILFGGKDVESSTKEDFHEVFSKIMNDPILCDSTKRLRVEELKAF